ncbi:MAG: VOC family protein [Armatimonadetes bacterium]|nr:VOC family protein [Armatimonadota bacterium]
MAKTHLSLNVADVDRAVAFYEAFFGIPAHKRRPGYANFDLSDPPLKLALNQTAPAERGNALDHLGVQVGSVEEVQAARGRLTASGLVSFDEGDTVCCYARQDKVWVQDPDGNKWEVYVLLDEMDDEDEAFGAHGMAASDATACCAASARMEAGGTACCAQPADGSACCG